MNKLSLHSCEQHDEKSLAESCKQLLKKQSFANQNEIRQKLIEMGYTGISQSTVSRLLSQLGVVKVQNTCGKKMYCITLENAPVRVESSILSQIEFISHNQHNVVIKTHPGSAQLVARLLDSDPHHDILGTVAGNDTVLVIPTDVSNIERCERLIRANLGMMK
ncbi:MAG: arginine repressor [Vibrio sp.]